MTDIEKSDRPERLFIAHGMVGDVRVVTVGGEIDHDVRDVLRQALLFEDDAPPPLRIVVDLSAVTFMDSSGINLFVACHQQVSKTHGWVRIASAQDSVLRVLKLVGLNSIISCHPSIEQALSA
ncbi:STAS domain-containing protein [Streptomyces sp. NPDC003401]